MTFNLKRKLFAVSVFLVLFSIPFVVNARHFTPASLNSLPVGSITEAKKQLKSVNKFLKLFGFSEVFVSNFLTNVLTEKSKTLIPALLSLNDYYQFYKKNKIIFPALEDISWKNLERNNTAPTFDHIALAFKIVKIAQEDTDFNFNNQEEQLFTDLLNWIDVSLETDDQTKFAKFVDAVVFLENWVKQFIAETIESFAKKTVENHSTNTATKTTSGITNVGKINEQSNKVKTIQNDFKNLQKDNLSTKSILENIAKWNFSFEQLIAINAVLTEKNKAVLEALTQINEILKNEGTWKLIHVLTSPEPRYKIFNDIFDVFVLSKAPLPLDAKSQAEFSGWITGLPKTKWNKENFLKLIGFLSIARSGITTANAWQLAQHLDKILGLYKPEPESFAGKISSRVSTSINARLKKNLVKGFGKFASWLEEIRDRYRKKKKVPPKPGINNVTEYRLLWAQLKTTIFLVPDRVKTIGFSDETFNLDLFRQSAKDDLAYPSLSNEQKNELAKLKVYDEGTNSWINFASKEGGIIWKFLSEKYNAVYDFVKRHWKVIQILRLNQLGNANLSTFDFLAVVSHDSRISHLRKWNQLLQYWFKHKVDWSTMESLILKPHLAFSHSRPLTNSFRLLFSELDKIAHLKPGDWLTLLQNATHQYTSFLAKVHLLFKNLLNNFGPRFLAHQIRNNAIFANQSDKLASHIKAMELYFSSPGRDKNNKIDNTLFFISNFLDKLESNNIKLPLNTVKDWIYGSHSQAEMQTYVNDWHQFFETAWKHYQPQLRKNGNTSEWIFKSSMTINQVILESTVSVQQTADIFNLKKEFFRYILHQVWKEWIADLQAENPFLEQLLVATTPNPKFLAKYPFVSSKNAYQFSFFNNLKRHFRQWPLWKKRLFVKKLISTFTALENIITSPNELNLLKNYVANNQTKPTFFTSAKKRVVSFSLSTFLSRLYKLIALGQEKSVNISTVLTSFFDNGNNQHLIFPSQKAQYDFLIFLRWFQFYGTEHFKQAITQINQKLQPYLTMLKNFALKIKKLQKLAPSFDWKQLTSHYQTDLLLGDHLKGISPINLPTPLLKMVFRAFELKLKPKKLDKILDVFLSKTPFKAFWKRLNRFGPKDFSPFSAPLFIHLLINLQKVGIDHLVLADGSRFNFDQLIKDWNNCRNTDCRLGWKQLSFESKTELLKLFNNSEITDYFSFFQKIKDVWFKQILTFLQSFNALSQANIKLFAQIQPHFFASLHNTLRRFFHGPYLAETTNSLNKYNRQQAKNYLFQHQELINFYPSWIAFVNQVHSHLQTSWKNMQLYLHFWDGLVKEGLLVDWNDELTTLFADWSFVLSHWSKKHKINQIVDLGPQHLLKLYLLRDNFAHFDHLFKEVVMKKISGLNWTALKKILTNWKQQSDDSPSRMRFFQEIVVLLIEKKWSSLSELQQVVSLLTKIKEFNTLYPETGFSLSSLLDYSQNTKWFDVDDNTKLQILNVATNLKKVKTWLFKQVDRRFFTFWKHLTQFSKSAIFNAKLDLNDHQQVDLSFLLSLKTPITTLEQLPFSVLSAFVDLINDQEFILQKIEQKLLNLENIKKFVTLLNQDLSTISLDTNLVKEIFRAFPWLKKYLSRWNFSETKTLKNTVFYILRNYFARSWKMLQQYWPLLKIVQMIDDNTFLSLSDKENLKLQSFHWQGKLLNFNQLSLVSFLELTKLQKQSNSAFKTLLAQKLEQHFGTFFQKIKPFLSQLKDKSVLQLEFDIVVDQEKKNTEKQKLELLSLFQQDLDAPLIDFSHQSLLILEKMFSLSDQITWLEVFKNHLTVNTLTPEEATARKKVNDQIKIAVSTGGGLTFIGVIGGLVWWKKRF